MEDAFESFKNKMNIVDEKLGSPEYREVQLAEISDLINKKLNLETRATDLREELNILNDDIENYNAILIPDKMMELGLSKVVTSSGTEVTIKKIYRGNISEKHSDAALQWFVETSQADSIKNAYTVNLGVGSSEESTELEKVLNSSGFSFQNKKAIAWNTLASILKDLDNNDDLDFNKGWLKLQEENKVPNNLTLKEVLGMYTKNTTNLKFSK